jgi:hypothetical protein
LSLVATARSFAGIATRRAREAAAVAAASEIADANRCFDTLSQFNLNQIWQRLAPQWLAFWSATLPRESLVLSRLSFFCSPQAGTNGREQTLSWVEQDPAPAPINSRPRMHRIS